MLVNKKLNEKKDKHTDYNKVKNNGNVNKIQYLNMITIEIANIGQNTECIIQLNLNIK